MRGSYAWRQMRPPSPAIVVVAILFSPVLIPAFELYAWWQRGRSR